MPYKIISCIGLIFFLLCSGCGFKEGVVHKEPKSYLWFTGNTQDAIVYIDNLDPVNLSEERASTGDDNTDKTGTVHYQISPGKHTIVIKKFDTEVVHRTILLGNGITKEIQIP